MEKEIFGFVIGNTDVGRFTHRIPAFTLVTVLPDPIDREGVAYCSNQELGSRYVLLEDLVVLHLAKNREEAIAYCDLIEEAYNTFNDTAFKEFCNTIGKSYKETVAETQKPPCVTIQEVPCFKTEFKIPNVTSYDVLFYNGTLSIKVENHA